ncbi:uncharacterized protein E5676_scaffold110G002440 [Cucumis melo var. makuwa]|uniref:Uncharacterized protein n=1 Tax=Cucumis melo var. makuwa TaxID=1194695 RepID=A0A5A7T0I5_CUCMM|nr:uncharacterized protein E6C27_scaffold20G001810 [Cucumis melo var. makuwa]TYJ95929.1 uncharacterized protein E5676_scaffold110G002440 [Cucumis melo var. makuwa]
MHPLDAHLLYRQFSELILVVKTQSSPSVDVVDDWLFLSFSCICQLHHTDDTLAAVKAIEKVPLKLLPTINGFRLKVGVLVENVSFESLDELFYQQIPSCTSSFTCFNKLSDVLFWVAISIKL